MDFESGYSFNDVFCLSGILALKIGKGGSKIVCSPTSGRSAATIGASPTAAQKRDIEV